MQEIEAKGYWFGGVMYPNAGNTVTGILAVLIATCFLKTVVNQDGEYVVGCTACFNTMTLLFTVGSLLVMLVLTIAQKDGEMWFKSQDCCRREYLMPTNESAVDPCVD